VCRYAKCRYAECRYAECRYAKCCYAECRYAECPYAECRYVECRGAIYNRTKNRGQSEKGERVSLRESREGKTERLTKRGL
jgi:hypothetical protein